MSNVWVIKDDGTRQCDDRNQGVSPENMKPELEALGATVLACEKRQDCRFIIAMCGAPTGAVNAFQISAADWALIEAGFVGPNGFRLWTCDDDDAVKTFGGEIPWPLANQISIATSSYSIPVLVRELIGMESRYYEDGAAITKDYRPNRANFVTEKGSSRGIALEV